MTASTDADELENTNADVNFVSKTPTPTFDDQVVWVTPNILKNRMISAGKLPMSQPHGFFDGFRNAGIQPGDPDELRLQKSLLIFATGLISLASMLWLFIYWQLGPQFSSTIPFLFQLLLVGNLAVYLKIRIFEAFRLIQLSLFLFMPFVAQWSIGNFITASGVSLWALLAPIGAILFIGAHEALAWFFAYLFLTALSGGFDYYLGDLVMTQVKVPTQTSVFFFALNFAAVSTIVFLLLQYSTSEKKKTQARLEEAHQQLQSEQERSERLLLNILPGPIAERLKNSNQTIADGFADVSVMFVDIVNFTRIAEGLNPQQVFSMLNRIFSSFDELARKIRFGKNQDHWRRLHGRRRLERSAQRLLGRPGRHGNRNA